MCLLAALAALGWFGGKAAADDLICQDRIVSEGSTTYDVQSLCGAPDATSQRHEKRRVRRAISVPCGPGPSAGRCTQWVEDEVDVLIDEWTYDFGPQRFLTYLSFVDGKVTDIRTGGYGHKLR
jgi:hypothetical protein